METACANSEGVATRAAKASITVPAKTIFLEFVFNMVTPEGPGTCRRQGGYEKRGYQRRLYIRGLAASGFFQLFTSRRPGSAGMVRRSTTARGTVSAYLCRYCRSRSLVGRTVLAHRPWAFRTSSEVRARGAGGRTPARRGPQPKPAALGFDADPTRRKIWAPQNTGGRYWAGLSKR